MIVRVVNRDEFQEHRRERHGRSLDDPMLQWQDGEYAGFYWECPGCGGAFWGELGGESPVGGWDGSQRWVNTGTRDAPTLQPSLGCGNWRRGDCSNGHWWLRDGELVAA